MIGANARPARIHHEVIMQPTAIITGASSGIGEAFAHLLAREGYRPVLIARRQAELERVAGAIVSTIDVDPVVMSRDLSTPDAAMKIQAEMDQLGLFPDLLVNNAGFGLMGSSMVLDLDEQIEMVDLNVRTLTELSLVYSRLMCLRGHGGIINVSSVGGTLPGPNMAVYYATKAYILNLTEALSVELKPLGVQITAVVPGVTKTNFHRRAGMEDSLLMRIAMPMSAQQVALLGYRGHCRGHRVVTTGLFNRLATWCTQFVPHTILLPVTAKLHT
ncbi:MAG: SDR family NAD(P)-dependent oxidoreductase [Aestuariivirgaceae bacterium]